MSALPRTIAAAFVLSVAVVAGGHAQQPRISNARLQAHQVAAGQVKERAVFALSQLPKDEGVPLLIEVARTNRNPVVRKRAVFWLGQSKDPRALSFFEQILR